MYSKVIFLSEKPAHDPSYLTAAGVGLGEGIIAFDRTPTLSKQSDVPTAFQLHEYKIVVP